MAQARAGGWRLGVDVGGTFTDLILVDDDGRAMTRKVLSTTENYADGIMRGMRDLIVAAGIGGSDVAGFIHGTTVATNTILERRGARTGLITTEGFRDILEIARLRLARLYDMNHQRPEPLVRRRWRFEVRERLDHSGQVVAPLDMETVEAAVHAVLEEDLEAVAVCLLHAYANPEHEQQIARMLHERAPHIHLTLSSEVLPEIREFERTSTTATNAYIMPVMDNYVRVLEAELLDLGIKTPLFIMQSNGGVMTADRARRFPVQLIESGPAAGVIAAAALARRLDLPNVISLDMGGTTAKASVIEDYTLRRSNEFEIGGPISQGSRLNKGGGYLLRTPAIDIAEVGAGGGSLVTVDPAGALHVGPQSAGAMPGPVCYDQGGVGVTLTDANVVLGYLAQDRLPSGLRLAPQKARTALEEQVARRLDLGLEDAAYGVYLVGCAGLARAVRAVTVERGRDPREFALVAFGGNGPLFAAELARTLEIGKVLVPPASGVFSALGLLEADIEQHVVRTFNKVLSQDKAAALRSELDVLRAEAEDLLRGEGYREGLTFTELADVKYLGQSFEMTVPVPQVAQAETLPAALAEAFGREHARTYGHRSDSDPIQVVNLRIAVRVAAARRPPVALSGQGSRAGRERNAYFGRGHGTLPTPVTDRSALGAVARAGPLLIDEYDATTLVPPGCAAHRDEFGNVVIEIGG